MSERKINNYYKDSQSKPLFSFLNFSKKIHYAFSPDTTKPILLLIHGAPGAWFGYKEFFKDSVLLTKYQIIAPDRAGYHKSGCPEPSITEQANLLQPLLKIRNNQKVSVLGRSYGAAIAAKLTSDNPDLVKDLFLIAPACNPKTEKFWWFSKPVNTKFARFFLPSYLNCASEEKFAHVSELEKMMLEWGRIRCPVTILQGGRDWIIDPNNGRFVDSVLINSSRKFIYLPNNGHLLTSERYELIRELLLSK